MTNFICRQPEGCLQWHTTLTGRFQTFNFAETTTPQHLASQKYAKNYLNLSDFFSTRSDTLGAHFLFKLVLCIYQFFKQLIFLNLT